MLAPQSNTGPLNPESIHPTIAGPKRWNRAERWAENILNPLGKTIAKEFVKTANCLANHPLKIVFFIWGALYLTRAFNYWGEYQSDENGGSLTDALLYALDYSALFQAIGVFTLLVFAYAWKKFSSPRIPDYSGYYAYYEHLKSTPVTARIDQLLKEAITNPQSQEQGQIFISFHTGYIAWLASFACWDAITGILQATHERFPNLLKPLTRFVSQLRNERTGLNADENRVEILKRLLSRWSEKNRGDSCLADHIAWFLGDSDDAPCLEILLPLLNTDDVRDKEVVFLNLFRLVLSDVWPQHFLESLMILYSQLSPERQADMNRYFSMFRHQDFQEKLTQACINPDDIEKAFCRLGSALLIATNYHTKPTNDTKKETAVMLDYAMPDRHEKHQGVYRWDEFWCKYRDILTKMGHGETLFSITQSYIYQRFLDAASNQDPDSVAMFLLAIYRDPGAEGVHFFDPVVKDIIDHGKMADVLKALMQVGWHKAALFEEYDAEPDINSLRHIAEAFINILHHRKNVELSPQEAAWLCHLHGSGANIAYSVVNLYLPFRESSWGVISTFQRMLLQQALQYVYETPVVLDERRNPTPDNIVVQSFYFQNVSLSNDPVEEDIKSQRIMGADRTLKSFMPELCVQDQKPPPERDPLLVSLYYRRFYDLLIVIGRNFWGEREELPEEASIRGLTLNRIIAAIRETKDIPVASRMVYFLLKALLQTPETELRYRCTYFDSIVKIYRCLLPGQSLLDALYRLQSTADDYSESCGALKLALEWVQALLLHAHEVRALKKMPDLVATKVPDSTLSVDNAEKMALEIIHSCREGKWLKPLSLANVSHFLPINLFLEHLIQSSEHERQALHFKWLFNFIETMEAQAAQYHLKPFFLLVSPFAQEGRLAHFKDWVSSQPGFNDLIRSRLVALLIYSLHPPGQAFGVQSSNVLTLFQKPSYLHLDKMRDVLETFNYPESLRDAEVVVQQLKNFGIQPNTLRRLIEQTNVKKDVNARINLLSF